ncbi:MAG: ribbon-helix-helix domain-containing protein [Nitrososphaeraceae archaeon]
MKKFNIVVSDDIEKRFRRAIAEYKGMKKGNISKAFEEAIELWLQAKSNPSAITPRS